MERLLWGPIQRFYCADEDLQDLICLRRRALWLVGFSIWLVGASLRVRSSKGLSDEVASFFAESVLLTEKPAGWPHGRSDYGAPVATYARAIRFKPAQLPYLYVS